MTYTKDQLKDLRDAIDAHLAGKPVQYQHQSGAWIDQSNPTFYSGFLWRPKPKPEPPKPWDCMADVPTGCWIRYQNGDMFLITSIQGRGVVWDCQLFGWDKFQGLAYSTTPANDASWKPCLKEPKTSAPSPTVSE